MKIKLALIIAFMLHGSVFSMSQKHLNITTPVEYFTEIEKQQEKEYEKNNTILQCIRSKDEQSKKDLEIIKENYDFCSSIDPHKQTKAFCYICRNHRSDDLTQPWVILKPCGHPYHINCIAQWGSVATESQARLCQNPQHAGRDKPYTLPKNIQSQLDKETAWKLMERGILPMNDEEQSIMYWQNAKKRCTDIIRSVKDNALNLLNNEDLWELAYRIYKLERYHRMIYSMHNCDDMFKKMINYQYMKQTIFDLPMAIQTSTFSATTALYLAAWWLNAPTPPVVATVWNQLKLKCYDESKYALMILIYIACRYPGPRNDILALLKNRYLKTAGIRA